MSKPKLNQPNVETTTTINVFKEGFPPTVVSNKYPVKNHSIKLTEQEIFKEFEKLGYKYQKCMDSCQFVNEEKKEVIVIEYKQYAKCDTNVKLILYFTFQEHQLLHKLFEIWGWFDE